MNFVTGDFSRSTARSARLKRDRFFAHGAVALAAWFCFGFQDARVCVFSKPSCGETKMVRRARRVANLWRTARARRARRRAPRKRGRDGRGVRLGSERRVGQKKAHGVCGVARSCFASPRRWRSGRFAEGERRRSRGETRRKKRGRRRDVACHRDDRGLDGSPVVDVVERENRKTRAPLRKAHVALGWLLALGGFANAVVGADLFRRLVARDEAFATTRLFGETNNNRALACFRRRRGPASPFSAPGFVSVW